MKLTKTHIGEAAWAAWSEKYRVPGITCQMIQDGELLEPESYGICNPDTREPMQEDTVFEAASLTKSMFAVLVLRLVDRGVFTLDEPIARRAPDLRISADERMEHITIRQILSHATGLPNWAEKPLTFSFDPGEGFRYSGEGYYFLHKIIDRVTGKRFTEHFRDEFFVPLSMNRSAVIWDPDIGQHITHAFDEKGRSVPLRKHVDLAGYAPEPNAAWSLYSTAPDYANFQLELLKHRGSLSEESFMALRTPQNRAADQVSWGLGVGIPDRDPSVLWHWGDNGAYRSFAAIDIETGDGISLFFNGAGGTALGFDCLRRCTDGVFWDEVERFVETAEDE